MTDQNDIPAGDAENVTEFPKRGLLTLQEVEGEPRIRDMDLAARLEMTDPHSIRRMIDANRAELESYGPVSDRQSETSPKGGRPGTEFWLNEPQALLICMFSRTAKAAEVRRLLVEVFLAWRRGQLPPHPGAAQSFEGRPRRRALPNLDRREINAWDRHINTVRQLFGAEAAARLYRMTPMGQVEQDVDPDGDSVDGLDVTPPGADGPACLAHLLAQPVARSRLSVGDMLSIARRDARSREALGGAGLFADPTNWRGWVAVAVDHPKLQRLFADSDWLADWGMALLGIEGARPSPDLILFPDGRRKAVLLPWRAVERAMAA